MANRNRKFSVLHINPQSQKLNKVSNIITNSEHKSFPLSDACKHDLKSCMHLSCDMTPRHVSGSTLAITSYKTMHSPVPLRTTQRRKASAIPFSGSHAWGQLNQTAFTVISWANHTTMFLLCEVHCDSGTKAGRQI